MKKHCSSCNNDLNVKDFYARNRQGDPATYCKTCFNRKCAERWILKKKEAIAYKGGSCEKCTLKTEHYSVYDFHHSDPSNKDMVWDRMRKLAWPVVKTELDKCQLLCSNCHRIEHEGYED